MERDSSGRVRVGLCARSEPFKRRKKISTAKVQPDPVAPRLTSCLRSRLRSRARRTNTDPNAYPPTSRVHRNAEEGDETNKVRQRPRNQNAKIRILVLIVRRWKFLRSSLPCSITCKSVPARASRRVLLVQVSYKTRSVVALASLTRGFGGTDTWAWSVRILGNGSC
eukprot:2104621-Rhodomonas_salina.1